MIVRVSGWVFEKTSLQGIPWVSAWVGAHRWSRVVAYWLFPPAFWASVVLAMPAFVVGLVSLGEWLVYDLAPGLLPALLLLLVIVLMFLVLVGMFLAPLLFVLQSLVLLFKFLLSMRSSTSWSDRIDPDCFLKVPYSQIAV